MKTGSCQTNEVDETLPLRANTHMVSLRTVNSKNIFEFSENVIFNISNAKPYCYTLFLISNGMGIIKIVFNSQKT